MPSHSRLNLLAGTLVAGIALHSAFAPDPRDLRNWWFEDRYLRQCRSNMAGPLGTACEMYSTDNGGRYPTSLRCIVPRYLKVIPPCPTTDTDTYSVTFQSASNPDVYTISCQGHRSRRPPPPEFGTYRSVGITQ